MDPDMARAFQEASGFDPTRLSNLLRYLTLAAFYLWGVWVIHGGWKQYATGSIKAGDLFQMALRTLLLLILVSSFFYFQG